MRQMHDVSRMPVVKTCHLNFRARCAETNALRNPLRRNLHRFNAHFNSPLLWRGSTWEGGSTLEKVRNEKKGLGISVADTIKYSCVSS